MKNKIENNEPVLTVSQHEIWGKVAEIAENQYSLFDGKLDKGSFIELCLIEFNIYPKNQSK